MEGRTREEGGGLRKRARWVARRLRTCGAMLAVAAVLAGMLFPARPAGAATLWSILLGDLPPMPNFDAPCMAIGPVVVDGDCALVAGRLQPFTPRREAQAMIALRYGERAEGLPPVRLPRDFARLSLAEQQFVLTDLERVIRGLPPILGLSRALDRRAASAAARDADANLVGTRWTNLHWGSNWAGDGQPAAVMYLYMYQDGWAGPGDTPNRACVALGAPGCWGHRRNILGDWGREGIMGVSDPCGDCGTSTQVFVAWSGRRPPLYYTWARAVRSGAEPWRP